MNTKTILIGLGVGVGIYLLWNKYGKKSATATTRPAEKTSSASGKGGCFAPNYLCNGECVAGSTICHGTISR